MGGGWILEADDVDALEEFFGVAVGVALAGDVDEGVGEAVLLPLFGGFEDFLVIEIFVARDDDPFEVAAVGRFEIIGLEGAEVAVEITLGGAGDGALEVVREKGAGGECHVTAAREAADEAAFGVDLVEAFGDAEGVHGEGDAA